MTILTKLVMTDRDNDFIQSLLQDKTVVTKYQKIETSAVDTICSGVRGYDSVDVTFWFSGDYQLMEFMEEFNKGFQRWIGKYKK